MVLSACRKLPTSQRNFADSRDAVLDIAAPCNSAIATVHPKLSIFQATFDVKELGNPSEL